MARPNLRLLIVCLVLVWCPLTLGHDTGAPENVCESMLPGHGIDQQESESPYILGVRKEADPAGDTVVVSIMSLTDSNFQGFFLQARDATDKTKILPGTFSIPTDSRRQTCRPGNDNTLTHENTNPKGNLTSVWTPPPNFEGQAIFRATVAERFDKFWMDLETVPLNVKGAVAVMTDNEVVNVDYNGCGVKKGCFGIPSDCLTDESCKVLLTYTPQSDGVVFEISSTVEGSNQTWLAVGLSDDRKMGDDSVTDCLIKSTGEVVVQQSWNRPKPNLGNFVIDNPTEGLSERSGKLVDGVLSCRWKRSLTTKIEGHKFDLDMSNYYLLLAKGEMKNDNEKRKHKGTAGASHDIYNLTLISPLPTDSPPSMDISYKSCGVSISCFGMPTNCVEKKNCLILLTYGLERDGVIFTITGTSLSSDNAWIAVGLSQDKKMGDDSVTDCLVAQGDQITVQQSWNYPKYRNEVLKQSKQGLSGIYGKFSDGILSCRWKRQTTTNIKGITFNLTSDDYFLLLAMGKTVGGIKIKHEKHIVSEESVNLTKIAVVAGKSTYLIKIHGSFMVIAWIGFVSVAILLARHYKNVWENDTLCTLKVWFACHRTLMMSAVGLIIAAFVCIFVYVDGWSEAPGPHPILGCVCTGLAVIQPVMAIFRPKPNASNRYIFNWLHWLVGNSAQIIAVVTMFYAVELSAANLGFGFYYALISFVAFHFCFHIVMQIHTYAMEKKVHNIIQMQDLSQQKGTPEFTKDAPGSGFRCFMLGIYIVINIGLVTALVLLITLP